MFLEEQYQIVVAEIEGEIKELEYLLQFKKSKAKLQKLSKLNRALALIHEMHGLINK